MMCIGLGFGAAVLWRSTFGDPDPSQIAEARNPEPIIPHSILLRMQDGRKPRTPAKGYLDFKSEVSEAQEARSLVSLEAETRDPQPPKALGSFTASAPNSPVAGAGSDSAMICRPCLAAGFRHRWPSLVGGEGFGSVCRVLGGIGWLVSCGVSGFRDCGCWFPTLERFP